MKRIKGFVVAYDVKSGSMVWTVRAKDSTSEHNGRKFQVESLHPGTMLTKPGVDVTFRVQSFGTEQEKVLRAVDVNVGSQDPEENPIMEKIPNALAFAVTVEGDKVLVWHSECGNTEDARQLYLGEGQQDALLGLIRITPELVLEHGGAISDDEAVAGLATVRQMAYLDPIRDVLSAIAAEAFKLGKESKQN